MKYRIVIVFLLFFNFFFAQTTIERDSVFAKNIKIFNTNYKEFEVVGNDIYAITKGDSLIKFNINSINHKVVSESVVSFVKNDKNKIYYLDVKGNVFRQIKKKQI